jgi:hypothetical protein
MPVIARTPPRATIGRVGVESVNARLKRVERDTHNVTVFTGGHYEMA